MKFVVAPCLTFAPQPDRLSLLTILSQEFHMLFTDRRRSIALLQPARAKAPKLLDRVRAAIRARHYSLRTEEAYAGWIRRFILFHNKRPLPKWLSPRSISFFRIWQ
jgi:streptomycin 6-kinase